MRGQVWQWPAGLAQGAGVEPGDQVAESAESVVVFVYRVFAEEHTLARRRIAVAVGFVAQVGAAPGQDFQSTRSEPGGHGRDAGSDAVTAGPHGHAGRTQLLDLGAA